MAPLEISCAANGVELIASPHLDDGQGVAAGVHAAACAPPHHLCGCQGCCAWLVHPTWTMARVPLLGCTLYLGLPQIISVPPGVLRLACSLYLDDGKGAAAGVHAAASLRLQIPQNVSAAAGRF